MKTLWTGFCLALLLVTSAWTSFGANVVCTTSLIGDIVSTIAGSSIPVEVLFPPDTDPHTFEPRPQDLVLLQRADLVFINGLDLEAALANMLEPLGSRVVSLSDHLPGLRSGDLENQDPDHGTIDPHVWFDPTLVSLWVDTIATSLCALAPAQETIIQSNAAAYQAELASLDEWIVSELAQIPPENRRIVTDHVVFGYFESRYGLEQVGTVFPGLSTLSEPSARDIAALISTILSLKVPAIFVGTTVNASLAEQIAEDTQTKVIVLYTGSLSEPDGPAPTYLAFMRYAVHAFVEGLARTP